MWQECFIAVVVAAAAGYVVWTFLALTRRQRLLDVLAAVLPFEAFARVAQSHRARLAAPGCGNCAAHVAGAAERQDSMQARHPGKAVKAGIKT